MAISDISTLSVLRTKMQWHQERQRVLAQNVANSDTPRFKPLDLVEPKFDRCWPSFWRFRGLSPDGTNQPGPSGIELHVVVKP